MFMTKVYAAAHLLCTWKGSNFQKVHQHQIPDGYFLKKKTQENDNFFRCDHLVDNRFEL